MKRIGVKTSIDAFVQDTEAFSLCEAEGLDVPTMANLHIGNRKDLKNIAKSNGFGKAEVVELVRLNTIASLSVRLERQLENCRLYIFDK